MFPSRAGMQNALAISFRVLGSFSPRGIIASAVLVRLIFCFAWGLGIDVPRSNVPLSGDTYYVAGADGYIQLARTLYTSGRYAFAPNAPAVHNRPPIHPVVMLIFGAWSADYWFMFWFIGSAFLWLICLSTIYQISRDLGLSRVQSNLALLLVGFHPYLIFISKTHTFINSAIAVLPITVWLFLRIPRKPIKNSMATGLACGIAALTHGTYILIAPLFCGLLFFLREIPIKRRLQAMALVVIVAASVVAPWTIRNYQTFGFFIPVVTGNGFHYWKGDGVYFGGKNLSAELILRETGRELSVVYYGPERAEDDRVLWNLALQDMRDRPLRLVPRLLKGIYAYWAPTSGHEYKALVSAILNFPLLLVLMVLLARNLRQRTLRYHQLVVVALVSYVVLAFAFFLSWSSYFTMVLPLLLLLAVSLTASAPWERSSESQAPAS